MSKVPLPMLKELEHQARQNISTLNFTAAFGRENCCPSEVINKDHLQVKVGPIWEMVQRKYGGFLHSICETSLRLFHVPVPRSKQAPLDHRWLQDGHCLHFGPSGAPYYTKFRPSQVTFQFPQRSSQKFQESFKMERFCCSQWAHKSTLWAYTRQTSNILLSKLLSNASIGLWQAPQRNPCLGCKLSI